MRKKKIKSKLQDISIYWKNDQFETNVCLVEASLGPFSDPDIVKCGGDRCKLIQCIKEFFTKIVE